MRCAVKNCNNDNNSKASTTSFFAFPSNSVLRQQWISFCCRNEKFNTKTSVICMEHFKPEDFLNKLQYDMGFTKRRLLNHGAVPSIKKMSAESERIFKKREQRIENRENKKTVEMLIKEYDETASAWVESNNFEICLLESSNIASAEIEQIEAPVEFCEQKFSSCSKNDDGKDETQQLKKELEFLRGENVELKFGNRNLQDQLNALSEKMEEKLKNNEFNIEALKNRLMKTNYELKNLKEKLLSIFTKRQIGKLKARNRRRTRKITKTITYFKYV